MVTKISTKGQVVLPSAIRRGLGCSRAIRPMSTQKVIALF